MKQKGTFGLEIITPEKVVVMEDTTFAVVPGAKGPLGILPGHAPLLGSMDIGILRVRDSSMKELIAFVSRGFFMITHEKVTMITREAELKDQIDLDSAYAAKTRAKKLLSGTATDDEKEDARDDLLKAETRIKVAKGTAFF